MGEGPERTRPGAPCPDAPVGGRLSAGSAGRRVFALLGINAGVPDLRWMLGGVALRGIAISGEDDTDGLIAERYLGSAPGAVYLIRPDQHVAARWAGFDGGRRSERALMRATGPGVGRWLS